MSMFTAPAAITNLVAMLKADPALAGVDVRDGPAITDDSAREALTVGYTSPDEDTAADGQADYAGLAISPQRENYQIHNAVAVLADEALGVESARLRVFELLACVTAALARDKTLGGVAMKASVRNWSLRQDQTDAGTRTEVRFDVEIDAFTK